MSISAEGQPAKRLNRTLDFAINSEFASELYRALDRDAAGKGRTNRLEAAANDAGLTVAVGNSVAFGRVTIRVAITIDVAIAI